MRVSTVLERRGNNRAGIIASRHKLSAPLQFTMTRRKTENASEIWNGERYRVHRARRHGCPAQRHAAAVARFYAVIRARCEAKL